MCKNLDMYFYNFKQIKNEKFSYFYLKEIKFLKDVQYFKKLFIIYLLF